jgi:hypothetical protein
LDTEEDKILLDWEVICRELKKGEMKKWLSGLDKFIQEPMRIGND